MSLKHKVPELPKDSIIISKSEYTKLKNDSNFLRALESAGVDNWEGYDIASDNYEKGEDIEEPSTEPECTATEEEIESSDIECEFERKNDNWWCTTHNCQA